LSFSRSLSTSAGWSSAFCAASTSTALAASRASLRWRISAAIRRSAPLRAAPFSTASCSDARRAERPSVSTYDFQSSMGEL
jgi:hypothetical protein